MYIGHPGAEKQVTADGREGGETMRRGGRVGRRAEKEEGRKEVRVKGEKSLK